MSQTIISDEDMIDNLHIIIIDTSGTYSLETVLRCKIVKRSVLEKALKRVGDENVVPETMTDINSLGYISLVQYGYKDPFYYDETSVDIDEILVSYLIDDCNPGEYIK